MRIAILRALQLGDLLCLVPSMRALRAAYPDAEIVLLGLPWSRQFVARFSRYLDRHIDFPGFPGMPEQPCSAARVHEFVAQMRSERFDLVLQMHGDGSHVNAIAAQMGGIRTAGYHPAGEPAPDSASFLEWRAREHEILRNLRLLEHLGIARRGTQLEFPLTQEDLREADALGLACSAYAVIHPGSQLPSRRWPAERFAQVADVLARDGLRVVLTGSSGEQSLVNETRQRMSQDAIDACGRTTLGSLAALVGGARVLVSNDTGLSHIAAAMRTPSIVVACGSDTHRWSPLDRRLHRVLHFDVECRPCSYRECPWDHACARGVGVGRVVAETQDLLRCAA